MRAPVLSSSCLPPPARAGAERRQGGPGVPHLLARPHCQQGLQPGRCHHEGALHCGPAPQVRAGDSREEGASMWLPLQGPLRLCTAPCLAALLDASEALASLSRKVGWAAATQLPKLEMQTASWHARRAASPGRLPSCYCPARVLPGAPYQYREAPGLASACDSSCRAARLRCHKRHFLKCSG